MSYYNTAIVIMSMLMLALSSSTAVADDTELQTLVLFNCNNSVREDSKYINSNDCFLTRIELK